MTQQLIDHILTRRSVSARLLTEPGPDEAALQKILQGATRVPDHGKIHPWRFIIIRGEARKTLGQVLRAAYTDQEAGAAPAKLDLEAERFTRAPLVIGVVSSIIVPHKIPEWEQTLSVGAVCLNLLYSAQAMGFGANWITEWYAYHPKVCAALGLQAHEKIAGFVYIGTASQKPEDRPRPALSEVVSEWRAPLG
ncbi:MAG TPA: nitroreductase [Alphaproteobacteria bacterium]|nr:nitroreductase [Alphaproteobacteria bacterium]